MSAEAARVHNDDIDSILAMIPQRQSDTYYAEMADKRILEHIRLFRQEDRPNTNRFFVEAIHVHPNIGGTDFTKEELERAAKTLSFRPINADHSPKYGKGKHLPYPANQTLWMTYDPSLEAVTGLIQLEFGYAQMVRDGRVSGLSVEYFSLGGVEGKGIVFTALALVSNSKQPADRMARIYGGLQL
jgi:hypothetical protein